MVLKKVSDAIKARDWLGVVLEILIVMVGIFLGLQVDDWNKNRQDRALEREYLGRLWVDAKTNEKWLDNIIEHYTSDVDGVRDAFDYILSDGSDAAQLALIKVNGISIGKLPNAALQDAAYQELVSSGRLGLIRNVSLREALQKVAVGERSYEGQLAYFRDVNLSLLPYEFENFDDKVFVKDENGQIDIEYRVEQYLGNQKYARSLLTHYSLQKTLSRNLQGIRDDNQKVLALLACELKKPECGNLPLVESHISTIEK